MAKTFLVTGATGNLGSAVASQLVQEGHKVIGTTTSMDRELVQGVDFYSCDLTSETSTSQLFDTLRTQYDSIDGVVMLVGGFAMGSISESSTDDVAKMMSLNFNTAYNTSQQAIEWMKNKGSLQLLFIGAKPAIDGGGAGKLPYVISKNAVMKLAEVINEDDSIDNIQASVVIPSIIDTPVNRESMPDANFNEWVTPDTLAKNISYLLSDEAHALRGTVLRVYNEA